MRRKRRIALGAAVLLGLADASPRAAEAPAPPARQFCAAGGSAIAPLAERPVRSVRDFGAAGDGITDDTVALRAALNGVPPGAILDFPAGTYRYSGVLTLARNDVVLRGTQAILQASEPARQALVLRGDRTAAIGLHLRGAARERLLTLESAQLVLAGRWVQAVGNSISGGASAGVFVDGARDFRIVGNRVSATLADGIHMTNGARGGIVEGNVVHETGDDLIAVVSYRAAPTGEGALARNILIANNTVWGNTWGRGITVVGGQDVAIVGNTISRVASAAGIYLAQESAYRTHGDRHIYVADNYVGDIQTRPSPRGGRHPEHGAIDINSSNQAPLEFIEVDNNVVDGAGFAGIRLLGEVCHVRLTNNALRSVHMGRAGPPIDVIQDLFHGRCAEATIQCRGNTVDGKALAATDRCPDARLAEWRGPGAADAAAPQGTTWASCVPP